MKWQYKTIQFPRQFSKWDESLTDLSLDGWEVVSVSYQNAVGILRKEIKEVFHVEQKAKSLNESIIGYRSLATAVMLGAFTIFNALWPGIVNDNVQGAVRGLLESAFGAFIALKGIAIQKRLK